MLPGTVQDANALTTASWEIILTGLLFFDNLFCCHWSPQKGEKRLDKNIKNAKSIIFLGRGLLYPLALEGALKLKEISYIHAEGFAAGEMKHGPIALIEDQVPVIMFLVSDGNEDKAISNLQEAYSRGAKIILIADKKCIQKAAFAHYKIEIPNFETDFKSLLSPLLMAIPAQLLAYHVANERGTDVDQPRNLAKSVTVE